MAASVGRVTRFTTEEVNTRIRTQAEASVAYYATHPDQIDRRLRELDEEWDIERTIELEAAGTVFTSLLLGLTTSRKWLLVPVFASTMLLVHAIKGGYPLLPLLRRLGLRTSREIAQERYALKALRGDFEDIDPSQKPAQIREAFDAADPGSASMDGAAAQASI